MADPEQVRILNEKGVAAWNAFVDQQREQDPYWCANLRAANLHKADLSYADFQLADLKGADLSDADLFNAGLSYANLGYADLSYADLSYADLSYANLRHANLRHANLTEVDLSGVDLSGVNLSGVNLSEVNLSGVDLSGVNLSVVDLGGVDLSGVDLSGADLSGVDLSGTSLRNANLKLAILTQANLAGADLAGASLRSCYAVQIDLENANLRGASLFEADLRMARLRRADLSAADLRNANLSGADLADSDLSGANFGSADLRVASLGGATVFIADFRHSILRGTDFSGANLNSADFSFADLRNAQFTSEANSGLGRASFLDLASCHGINLADFGTSSRLPEYLTQAFKFAHRSDTRESQDWPSYVEIVLNRIKALRALHRAAEPPPLLARALDTLTAHLIDYLTRHPKKLYEIDPRTFEELVAEVLASYGWKVDLTPKSGDGGYDIFALSPNGQANVDTSWIIECKRYAPDRPVGVDIVRALYGSNAFRPKDAAMKMLATTSHFTKGVHEMKASKYDLALKDYEGILEWLNTYRPNPNGRLWLDSQHQVRIGDEE